MLKRCLCGILAMCLLFSCSACSKKVDLEDVKTAMVTQLQLSPTVIGAAKAQEWYGITADNCKQAVTFMLTENHYPAEIVMVKAVDEEAAQLIAAAISRRLTNLKSQTPDRSPAAMSCVIQHNGNYVAMFFSEQHDAMLAVYQEYIQ